MTIGLDLDMTLVDSRPVSRRALERLEYAGPRLDVDALMERYGLPPARWLPAGTDIELFRHLQLDEVARTRPMPGAADAVEAIRHAGHRAVVVTASRADVAARMLCAAELEVDGLWGGAWGAGKATLLRAELCWAYVGDHEDDMAAARQAGAIAVGVATGTAPPLGADVHLTDLSTFPAWLRTAEVLA